MILKKQKFKSSPSKEISVEHIFSGFVFDFENVTYRRDNGEELKRYRVSHPGATCVLPIINSESEDWHEHKVILIYCDTPIINRTLLQIPAGLIDPGEKPIDAAARELEEETGYRTRNIMHFCDIFLSPGLLKEKIKCFIATDLEYVGQSLQEDEIIEPVTFSIAEAIEKIKDGTLEDSKTISVIFHYVVNFL